MAGSLGCLRLLLVDGEGGGGVAVGLELRVDIVEGRDGLLGHLLGQLLVVLVQLVVRELTLGLHAVRWETTYLNEGMKELFYLMTHSTHFIYGYMERKGNVLFNDALNSFYLRLYGRKELFLI